MYWPGMDSKKRKRNRSSNNSSAGFSLYSSSTATDETNNSGNQIRTRSATWNNEHPESKKRRMTDSALHPLKGVMRDRLNKSLTHNPICVLTVTGKRGKCALH